MPHLWEIDHPYYCNHGNYFASSRDLPTEHHRSFAEFIAANGDADKDMNLIFRWDWKEGEDHDLAAFNGDVNYRNGELCIYYMGQSKGLYRWVTVEVCRADEPDVIAFLRPMWDHLRLLWAGISDQP